MNGSISVMGEVIDLVRTHGSMSLRDISAEVKVPADEIRRQVEAYSCEALSASLRPGTPVSVHIEPLDDSDPPTASDDDLVGIDGDPSRGLLGAERFDASVFGPLYEAALDLATREPDNLELARACRKLLDHFLPGVKARRRHNGHLVARIDRAMRDSRQVRIKYSRSWNPGVVDRVIEPYALVSTVRGVEVDAGPVQPDGNIRTYLVSRIRDLEVLTEGFERPPDADELHVSTRTRTTVRGFVPNDRFWAIRKWAETVRVMGRDETGTQFEADLLPPVGWRAALMILTAGPKAFFQDDEWDEQVHALARRIWEHHRLDEP